MYAAFRKGKWIEYTPSVTASSDPRWTDAHKNIAAAIYAKHAAKQEGARFTFPADAPDREIDFVYAAPRERWNVLQSCAIDERVASDHRPVLTVLSLQRRGD
jgi:endonuclease/exonuclease/phosphatase family metal-dependent hydrolase